MVGIKHPKTNLSVVVCSASEAEVRALRSYLCDNFNYVIALRYNRFKKGVVIRAPKSPKAPPLFSDCRHAVKIRFNATAPVAFVQLSLLDMVENLARIGITAEYQPRKSPKSGSVGALWTARKNNSQG